MKTEQAVSGTIVATHKVMEPHWALRRSGSIKLKLITKTLLIGSHQCLLFLGTIGFRLWAGNVLFWKLFSFHAKNRYQRTLVRKKRNCTTEEENAEPGIHKSTLFLRRNFKLSTFWPGGISFCKANRPNSLYYACFSNKCGTPITVQCL